ncbi:MAG: NADH-quinone oxidoreductase subunit N, partial [Rhodospirillales bacterium]|nr:NADH-quinone oxidoreductase subunit N [Rhodospirillales bacterium]
MSLAPFPNLLPAIPEIFLAIAAMILLMIGVYSRQEQSARIVSYASIVVLIITLILVGIITDGRTLTFGGA